MIKLVLVNITKDMECPPLTLAYLATYLKKNMEDKIKIKVVDINFEDPLKKILQIKPDIIGISSMSVKYNYAKKLAKGIKEHINVPIIIGGVHISTCPESLSNVFDIGIIGEGEKTTLELMQLFEKKHSFKSDELRKIPGLIFWHDGRVVRTPSRELTANLDDIPIPNRSFLDRRYFLPKISYNKLRGERVIEAGLLTSRGCPYRCIFCSTTTFWKRARFHSPDHVAKEIEYLIREFKVDYILIYDDLFAVNEERVKKIYRALKKKGLIGKVRFSCSLRANLVTDNLCKWLKKIGIVTANFGFESGSNKVLRYLKGESVTVEQNKKAVILCRRYGFDVNGSFMLASPTETVEDMHKTLEVMDWMKRQGATELWCGVTKPYPATLLWNYAIKNRLINKNFNWNLVDPSYPHNPIFLDKSIDKRKFLEIFKEAKHKSMEMKSRKEEKFLRRIKDFIYYNKSLYDTLSKSTRKEIIRNMINKIGVRVIEI